MGFLDRLLGRDDQRPDQPGGRPAADPRPYGQQSYDQPYGQQSYDQPYGQQPPARPGTAAPARSDDEIAVERYRYLLRTAPPETIEQVHAEAFEKLTPEQRRLVFDELSAQSPEGERPRGDDAGSLAQAATRSELRQPGTLERTLGGGGGPGQQGGAGRRGPGMGSMIGGSLLGTVAGFVIGSALVSAFLPDAGATAEGGEGDGGGEGDTGADSADAGTETAGADSGAGDGGGDFGGGDFGGGGFGGGDFGGGDFGGFDI
ncbi:hypothetical protein ASF17_01670 [Frigoribacterium sp. Leaf263]|uniref:hypothetical protein n=1 Tax=Frigoribacterium sp. Leaf263 TaxID=1736313 RepID=UPI00070178AE|nr:hypothetical protein [Frigoribacterium sp. Leaf263]KQO84261.1 hypothetical protein ASF17_01670 [Frigoribacterium sp. Leaf263]